MEQAYIVNSETVKGVIANVIQKLPIDPSHEVLIRRYKSKRSEAQNRLYWKWLSEIAAQYYVDGKRHSKEDWHDLCSMFFIGTKTIDIGGREFPRPSKSTTKLNVSEFAEYLTKIEAHFIEKGVALTFTDDYGPALGKS